MVCVSLSTGCLQLETHVKLHENGSATITERLAFSRRLLDMAKGGAAEKGLEMLLTKESALKRMEQMGKGVTLVSHKLQDGEAGCRESVVVYKAADLTEFAYMSPFLVGGSTQARKLRFKVSPNLKLGQWGRRGVSPGLLIVTFESENYKKPKQGAKKSEKTPAAVSPLDLQVFREVSPVFADMMKDLKLKLTFESYAPIVNYAGIAHRDFRIRPSRTDLVNISGDQLDKYGYDILENPEILLEVLTNKLSTNPRSKDYGFFYTDNMRGMQNNHTLPLINQSWRASVAIQPSLPLFKRYLAGKTLDWTPSPHRHIKARGKVAAKFEDVGWKGK